MTVHEYSVAQALLARVESEARARRAVAVHRITVQLGEVSGVDVDLFATAFALVREGTVCAGATLDMERVALAWTCPRCGEAIAPGSVLRCAACDAPARLTGGDEVLLKQIEMEIPDV